MNFGTSAKIIAILFYCGLARAGTVTHLYDLSPEKSVVDGVTYPQNEKTLYRGTDSRQMDLPKAVRALFGDATAPVESFFFSAIKNRLLQTPPPTGVELNAYLQKQIDALILQNHGALSLAAATTQTEKLVDETLTHLAAHGDVIPRYVDYQSPSYIDWPKDVVFSTLLSPVAATYGDKVLVIREQKPRSLDLNYWNQIANGVAYNYTRDIGEFASFGYVPAEDLKGYQVRSGSSKSWHSISYALYKSTAKSVVLVFGGERQDGSTSSCMDLNPKDQVYYHCEYRRGSVIKTLPPLSSEKARLLGVIVSCDQNLKACSKPSAGEVRKYSGFTNAAVTEALQEELKNVLLPRKLKLIKFENLGDLQ